MDPGIICIRQEDDFQIIDTMCFNRPAFTDDSSYFSCHSCNTLHNEFICQKCINSGNYANLYESSEPSLGQLCKIQSDYISQTNDLHVKLAKLGFGRPDLEKELQLCITSLRDSVEYYTKQNERSIYYAIFLKPAERKKLHGLRQLEISCQSRKKKERKKIESLNKNFNELNHIRTDRSLHISKSFREIENLNAAQLHDLFCTYFPTTISTNIAEPDRIVGTFLHIDKQNVFTGPEPLPSNQLALSHCVTAVRGAFGILNLWMPPMLKSQLQLMGSVMCMPPQRDHLGRVHSALIHAVHFLGCTRALNIRSILPRFYPDPILHSQAIFNPLLIMHCLGSLKDSIREIREFDAPYVLSLNGIFGDVPAPSEVPFLTLQTPSNSQDQLIETAEEVDENYIG